MSYISNFDDWYGSINLKDFNLPTRYDPNSYSYHLVGTPIVSGILIGLFFEKSNVRIISFSDNDSAVAEKWLEPRKEFLLKRLAEHHGSFDNKDIWGTLSGFGNTENCGAASLEPFIYLDCEEDLRERLIMSNPNRIYGGGDWYQHVYLPDFRDKEAVKALIKEENDKHLAVCHVAQSLGKADKMLIQNKTGAGVLWGTYLPYQFIF